MSILDIFKKKKEAINKPIKSKEPISKTVSKKIDDTIYDKIDALDIINFSNGNIVFFNKNYIDQAQMGYRINPKTQQENSRWVSDDYIVIGYDSTAGCGHDPIIIDTKDPDYPVYWLLTSSSNWENPEKIANSLDEFINNYKLLYDYKDKLVSDSLTNEDYNNLIQKISMTTDREHLRWWISLLRSATMSK